MPPIIPDKIPCQTSQQFSAEVSLLRDVMGLEETEETWDRMERGLMRFSAVIKGGGHQFKKELVDVLKSLQRPMISALNSERTRLSTAVLDCISTVAPRVGLDFEPLVSIYVPPILRLSNRTNKVYVTRSHALLALIIGFCHIPSILPHLVTACKENKIATGRTAAIEGTLRALNKWDWSQKEIRNRVTSIEEMIRLTGRDKDAGIRQISRQVFEAYRNIFPERLDEFTAPLTPVTRKYLEIKPEERGRPVIKQIPSSSTSTKSVPASGESNALGLRVRSTSSHRVRNHPPSPSAKNTRPKPVSVRTMPPPATVPNKDIVGSRPPSCPSSQEDRDSQERHRLLSSMSSTLSVKSVPALPKQLIEHRPPVRLATSQSRSVSAAAVALTSTGPARRIRRVVSVEQTNRPDLFAMAKKAAARTLVQKNQSNRSEESATDTKNVAFPISDAHNSGIERRGGAQRVPKALPLSASSDNKEESKSSNPPESAVSKDPTPPKETKPETKPSLSRRALSADARSDQKAKSGFVPRRGGVTQPTMSQLNKQRPPVSNAQPRPRVFSTLKRPGAQKKVIKPSSSESATELAEPITGESGQIQNKESADRHGTGEPIAVSSEVEGHAQIVNDTEQETDGPKIAISESESPALVDSPGGDTLATRREDIIDGSSTNQTEDEIRSRESTPAPQTPSSSVMLGKGTDKQMWENIKIVPEVMQDTSSISVNSMSPEQDRSSAQTSLVEVLITE